MAVWGIISTATAACQSFGGLVAARFFLGFVEAAYFVSQAHSEYFTTGRLCADMASLAVFTTLVAGTPERSSASVRPIYTRDLLSLAPSLV